ELPNWATKLLLSGAQRAQVKAWTGAPPPDTLTGLIASSRKAAAARRRNPPPKRDSKSWPSGLNSRELILPGPLGHRPGRPTRFPDAVSQHDPFSPIPTTSHRPSGERSQALPRRPAPSFRRRERVCPVREFQKMNSLLPRYTSTLASAD